MRTSLSKARTGQSISLIDEINDENDPDVLDAMIAAVKSRGQSITSDEMRAFSERRKVLVRK